MSEEEVCCNTCMTETENLVQCFHECSYLQCINCLTTWLKIENKKPIYNCPQCKKRCEYNYMDSEQVSEFNKKFSEYCRKNENVVDLIFKKIAKYKFKEDKQERRNNSSSYSIVDIFDITSHPYRNNYNNFVPSSRNRSNIFFPYTQYYE